MNHLSYGRFKVCEKPVFYCCSFGGSLDFTSLQEELSIYGNMTIRVRMVLIRKVVIVIKVLIFQSLSSLWVLNRLSILLFRGH